MAENTTAKGESVASSGQETKEGQENKPTPRIIVQSSACYTLLFRGRHGELLEKVSEAAQRGFDILEEGGTAVDAVENAVRFLEDINYFNAGRGSLLNNDGEVECDAMIMDGHTLNTGAVMAASNFLHPVSISRKIMEESHHCALSGAGAVEFARRIDFPTCEPEDLVDEETSLKKIYTYEDYPKLVGCLFEGKLVTDTHDTVAAVALDGNGHFACATSSGGIPGKWKGRIGDAPLVGCGGYANKHGAATASGHGEAIMKMTLAREIVYKMEGGENAEESTKMALKQMKDDIDGYGGAIAIDKNGNFGKASNSAGMLWASIKDGELDYKMEKKESIRGIEDRLCKLKISVH